ncbi:MAG: YidC/Oxa1 family insertase periplasmic-domain containing protein, partial [Planctomycetota bacterium]
EDAADDDTKPEAEMPVVPERWLTLGSLDPKDPYRMLVLVTSRGAAVARVQFNSPQFRDQEDRSGFLGNIVVDATKRTDGCPVQLVEPGSPAAAAGLRGDRWEEVEDRWVLREGDVITALDGKPVAGAASLNLLLSKTRPGDAVELTVERDGNQLKLGAELGPRPLSLITPEDRHLSMLLTLQQLGDMKLPVPETPETTVELGTELKGINLWNTNWEVAEQDRTHVRFRKKIREGLEIEKTYRLAEVPANESANRTYPAYHLELEVALRNQGDNLQQVAYQLDGPNGLPTEGAWFASKISRAGGAAGLRDVIVFFDGDRNPIMANAPAIGKGDVDLPWREQPLVYIGVDGQYFAGVFKPEKKPQEEWHSISHPLRVGNANPDRPHLTNTSVRVVSLPRDLQPGDTLEHKYTVFLGPKKPELLTHYQLDELVYYGWFWPIARPMVWLLHLLYSIVGNYGLAIILLTVIVRGCMFPVSRTQALGAMKMQQLQPELKRLAEKHKSDAAARAKAQQELFRKHNYNPLNGCLLVFIQLPIFIALYRTLMVDVDLRQAPLFTEAIRWCSNLAAPDMLYDWSWLMPEWVNSGQGMFALGPYFNLLPLVTVGLFLWQQKMFMPPPADEQQAMQQKVMSYMMLVMGLFFFKVASGLCIYFIASSLWGVAERKILPKAKPGETQTGPQTRAEAKAEARVARTSGDGAAARGPGKQANRK